MFLERWTLSCRDVLTASSGLVANCPGRSPPEARALRCQVPAPALGPASGSRLSSVRRRRTAMNAAAPPSRVPMPATAVPSAAIATQPSEPPDCSVTYRRTVTVGCGTAVAFGLGVTMTVTVGCGVGVCFAGELMRNAVKAASKAVALAPPSRR